VPVNALPTRTADYLRGEAKHEDDEPGGLEP